MDGFNVLSLDKVELESFHQYRQENQPFSYWQSPTRAFALSCKAKWLITKIGKLFQVVWIETIRIKPRREVQTSLSMDQSFMIHEIFDEVRAKWVLTFYF